MSRVRVLHATKFYPPVRGGMETVVADLCNGTADDWDVQVVAAHTAPETKRERWGRVDVVRSGTVTTISSVPICPSMPLHLWRAWSDCVVFHEPNPVAGTALFLRTPARHLIVWHHSDLVRPWWAPHTYGHLQRALYRRADCVIVSSPNLAAESELVRQARRVEIIPFGIALGDYRRDDVAERGRVDHIRSTIAGPRVLFVGRFVYYKGVQVLIDAMSTCPGTLILAGEGPLEPSLRQQVARLGLADRVVFAGRVSDEELRAYYRAADLFVLPSIARTEAFGVVQIEAMAAGVPVISTNLPTGVPWVNQDGVSGFVVPPGDADALAAAMRRVLGDGTLRARLGSNAAARADAMFDRRTMVDAFKRVVESVVGAEGVRERAPWARARVS
jgi:rhamnosyl/mannosyltransferase